MFQNSSRKNPFFKMLKGIFFLAMITLLVFVFGNVIMFLWNEILVEVVPSIKKVTFWQALGLFVLSRILFGGFKGGSPRRRWKRKGRQFWKRKWMGMNDEEKAKFKEKWQNRCNMKKEN